MKVLLKKISLWHWEKSLLVIENSLLVMACKGVYLQMELFACFTLKKNLKVFSKKFSRKVEKKENIQDFTENILE